MPSLFLIDKISTALVLMLVWRVYTYPFIGSGSLPISPNGQPNPVGDIWRIDVKLPVDGAFVPQS